MAVLYLMRHAQAENAGVGSRDHDRPLDPEGQTAARRLGQALVERKAVPGMVLCSTARRARETWEAVATAMPAGPELVLDDALYLAPPQTLLDRLAAIDPRHRTVMFVGHNPGLYELALALAQGGAPEALEQLSLGFPPAAVAALKFAAKDWSAIETDDGELLWFLTADTA